MAETIYISGDPSQSASWSNGLPSIDIDVILNASSGACSLNDVFECRKLSVIGYANTLATNGNAVTLGNGGFDAGATAIPGTVNFGASTVTNFGPVTFGATPAARMVTNAADWVQRGGSDAEPNVFTIGSASRTFNAFTFAVGSVTQFPHSTASLYANKHRVAGKVICLGYFYHATSGTAATREMVLEATANIAGPGTWQVIAGPLSGTINENTATVARILFDSYNTTIPVGDYLPSVNFRGRSGASTTIAIPGDTRFLGDVNIDKRSSDGNTTIDAADVEFLGSLATSYAGSGTFAVSGIWRADGTSDQIINVSGMDSPILLAASKPAGNVVVEQGSLALAADSEIIGELTNRGTLDVPTGILMKVNKYIDTPTGTLSGAGTLKTQMLTRE